MLLAMDASSWSYVTVDVRPLSVSLPGLTGQSSIPGRWLLDRPVKPGDDTQWLLSTIVQTVETVISSATPI